MRHLFRLVALFVALCGFTLPGLAADKVMLVLDASGSMWAQIEGRSRIEIARDSLSQVLAEVSPELELGFMAYGHRSKGDCGDIELMVAPEAGSAERISKAAMSLNPRGKTPLSAAVRMAAEQLKFTEDKASVVLITDGIETCNADPCALAGELEAAGIDFTVNVVGFGLSAEEGAAVRCLADETGGKYLGVTDADGLKNAIDVVVNDAAPVPEEPKPEEPVSAVNFAPVAYLSAGDDPLVDTDIVWEFSAENSDGSAGEWVRTEYGSKFAGEIEPGRYIVTARLDYVRVSQPVEIVAGAVARPEFLLDAGHVTVRPIAYEGGDVDADAAVFLEYSNGESTTFYGEARTFATAGPTRVTVTIGAAKVEETLDVVAGERLTRDIVVGVGRATVNAYYIEGMKADSNNVFTEIFSVRKDIQGNRKSFGYTYGPDAAFDLLPGDYVAAVSFDRARVEQPFSVVAGEGVAVDVTLGAGVLAIEAPGASWIQVFGAKPDIQGNREDFGGDYSDSANRTLPAGDYLIEIEMSGDAADKSATATVTAGERTELRVD
jgi:Ca-activated chloride channel family protein